MGFFSKSSEAGSSSTLEQLAQTINTLVVDDNCSEFDACSKVCELARKHREILEAKVSDLDAFIMSLESRFASPMILAAIRAIYDVASNKNYEAGLDRATDLLRFCISENRLIAERCRMVPDLFYPLLRDICYHVLKKEGKEDRKDGQAAFSFAFDVINFAIDPNDRVLTSLHAAFVHIASSTGKEEAALPFICNTFSAISNELNPVNVENGESISRRKSNCPSYFDPKYLLQYLYSSAICLIKLKEFRRALLFLESCLIIPGSSSPPIQLDALKKYHFVSLIVRGRVVLPPSRSNALLRTWKTKNKAVYEAYTNLGNAGELKSNKVAIIERVIRENAKFFENEASIIEQLRQTLRDNSVIEVAKSYSVITLANLARRCSCSEDEARETLQSLVSNGRINARMDGSVIYLDGIRPINGDDIRVKEARIGHLQHELERLDVLAQLNPIILVRSLKSSTIAFMQDDEGLSMTPSPMDM